jgi:hypothetical protein
MNPGGRRGAARRAAAAGAASCAGSGPSDGRSAMGCGASSSAGGGAYALAPAPVPVWRLLEPELPPEPEPEPKPELEPEPEPELPEPSFDLLGQALLLRVCGCLSARDLTLMTLVSRRFNEQMEWCPCSGSPAAASKPALRSVVEQAARRWVLSAPAPDQARAAAAWAGEEGEGRWLCRMREICEGALVFRRSHELVRLSEGGAVATKVSPDDYGFRAAASSVPMRCGGRYYAAFTILKYVGYMLFGVIRPPVFHATYGHTVSGCDVEAKWAVHDVEGHWFYSTGTGSCRPRRPPDGRCSRNWEQVAEGACEGDTIGMLLDLDAGERHISILCAVRFD